MRADTRSWQVLSRGLIAYGLVGLVVASIGLGSMVWVNGRIDKLRSDTEATLAQAAATTQLAAIALRAASDTATSFGGTVAQSSQAVSAAAQTLAGVQTELVAVEGQLRSVNIFGATPLASAADSVARIATSIDGLKTDLPLIAGDLQGNRDALRLDAAAISSLASSTDALAARLGPGTGQDSFDDVQRVIAMTLLMFAAWAFVPALGALGLGVWLRRQLAGP